MHLILLKFFPPSYASTFLNSMLSLQSTELPLLFSKVKLSFICVKHPPFDIIPKWYFNRCRILCWPLPLASNYFKNINTLFSDDHSVENFISSSSISLLAFSSVALNVFLSFFYYHFLGSHCWYALVWFFVFILLTINFSLKFFIWMGYFNF